MIYVITLVVDWVQAPRTDRLAAGTSDEIRMTAYFSTYNRMMCMEAATGGVG